MLAFAHGLNCGLVDKHVLTARFDVPGFEPRRGRQNDISVFRRPRPEGICRHDEVDGGKHLVDDLVRVRRHVEEVRRCEVQKVDGHGVARNGGVVHFRALVYVGSGKLLRIAHVQSQNAHVEDVEALAVADIAPLSHVEQRRAGIGEVRGRARINRLAAVVSRGAAAGASDISAKAGQRR